MGKYGPDVIPCHEECDEAGETKACKKCGIIYCKHFASLIDIQFCANCVSDVSLKETILEKIVEHIRSDGSVSFSRKHQAKYVKIMNVDWLFLNHAITEMNDSDIDASIELHRANVDLLLSERESRKLERVRKLAGIRVIRTTTESQEQREKRENKEAERAAKAGKKTSTKNKTTSTEDLAKLLAVLAKAGLTPEQIIAMSQGGKK